MDENVISSPKKLISAQPLVFNILDLFMSQVWCERESSAATVNMQVIKVRKVRGSGTAGVITPLTACISGKKLNFDVCVRP